MTTHPDAIITQYTKDYDPDFDPLNFAFDDAITCEKDVALDTAFSIMEEIWPPRRYMRDSQVDTDPGKSVYVMHHGPLSQSSRDYLIDEAFHRTIKFEPRTPHDHPLSHALTEINEEQILRGLRSRKFIDLFGNSSRNAELKTVAKNMYGEFTGKDALRNLAQENFKNRVKFSMEALTTSTYAKWKEITAIHTLYYLTPDQIGEILHACPGRIVHALVHRHPHTSGFLNNGELSYKVDDTGGVTQTNVLTGEKYSHRNLEPWFHVSETPTVHGSIAWTTTKLCGDSYYIKITAFAGKATQNLGLAVPTVSDFRVSSVEKYSLRRWLGYSWIHFESGKHTVVLNDVGLYDCLCKHIAGRERNQRYRQDLWNMARRLTDPKDIFAIHGGVHYDVPQEMLVHYVNAAFYAGVKEEINSALSHKIALGKDAEALNAYYSTGSFPTDYGVPIKLALEAADSVSQAVGATARATWSALPFVPFGIFVKLLGELTAGVVLGVGEALHDVIGGSNKDMISLMEEGNLRRASAGLAHILEDPVPLKSSGVFKPYKTTRERPAPAPPKVTETAAKKK